MRKGVRKGRRATEKERVMKGGREGRDVKKINKKSLL
jgi:hypothetical protein